MTEAVYHRAKQICMPISVSLHFDLEINEICLAQNFGTKAKVPFYNPLIMKLVKRSYFEILCLSVFSLLPRRPFDEE